MKKRLSLLFSAVVLVGMMLSACGNTTKTTDNSSNTTTSSSKKSAPTAQTTKPAATSKNAVKTAATGKIVDIKVMAKDFEYDKKVIHVKKGEKVRITLHSDDGGHGFALPAFNVNIQGNKSAEFIANKTGTFEYHCSIVCGSGHMKMTGKLIVE